MHLTGYTIPDFLLDVAWCPCSWMPLFLSEPLKPCLGPTLAPYDCRAKSRTAPPHPALPQITVLSMLQTQRLLTWTSKPHGEQSAG